MSIQNKIFWENELRKHEKDKTLSFGEMICKWYVSSYWYSKQFDTCICGEKINHCYQLTNMQTGDIIEPVGSECIKNFEYDQIIQEAKWTRFFSLFNYSNAKYEDKFGMKKIIDKEALDYVYFNQIINKREFHFLLKIHNAKKLKFTEKQVSYAKWILFSKIKQNLVGKYETKTK